MNNAVGSRKSIRYSLAGLLALVTFCGFGSCVLRTVSLRVSAENVTAKKANEMLRHVVIGSRLQVPESASNVTFRAAFFWAFATFEVEEEDFMEWAEKRHNWRLEPIVDGQCRALSNLSGHFDPAIPESISNGLSFTNSSERGGWDVVYDRDRKRVWLDYGHH